ncbi:MAG: lipid A export permease/ATP-binding protein MsbA [Gammaproteobacteria bacterium]
MTDPGSRPSARLYLRLLQYVRPHARVFALSIAAMALLAATEPVLPWLLKVVLDEGFVVGSQRVQQLAPLGIVLLFLVKGVLGYAGTVALHWVANRTVMDLRMAMFRRLLALPSRFYDAHSSGAVISKLTYDVTQVSQAATRVLSELFKDSLGVAALAGYMIWLEPRLAAFVFAIGPGVAYTIRRVSRRMREMSRRVQRSMGEITQVAQEAVEGNRVVKIYGGQDYEGARFARAVNDQRRYIMKVVMASAANVPVIQFMLALGIAAATWFGLRLNAGGSMTAGEFVSFTAAAVLLFPPAKRLTSLNEHIQRGLAAAESIFSLVDELGEEDAGRRTIERARGRLQLRAVGFRYAAAHEAALAGIDLDIEPGTTVALVGASGAGKSTLAALIPRLYPIGEGAILLDGIDTREFTLSALRAQIALVSQDVVLFNDTIRNNIAYGAARPAAAEVERAAQAAHVLEFVRDLPEGLDTMIGDRGVRLSGGQRQRLAIARALLKDAPILILDEATSSLDSVSERHIQDALETLRRGRTCLVIAHRLATVENADRIVVLEAGRVAEQGTHAELIRRGGVYARLYRTQFMAAPEAGAAVS